MRYSIECRDVLNFPTDLLILKHANQHYGADRAVADRLHEEQKIVMSKMAPAPDEVAVISQTGSLPIGNIMFVGMLPLHSITYADIESLGMRALLECKRRRLRPKTAALTIHGPGFGLDEEFTFMALLEGIDKAEALSQLPSSLKQITIVERDFKRAKRLDGLLAKYRRMSAEKPVATGGYVFSEDYPRQPEVFVAIDFDPKFDDHYDFGIYEPIKILGYKCERMDLMHFTGDILKKLKDKIAGCDFLVAELSSQNANVYLEVGYAWGLGVPTILVADSADKLKFDVQGHRCITYTSIRNLREQLQAEIEAIFGKRSNRGATLDAWQRRGTLRRN